MWLPRPVYEALPYAGVAAGCACFAAAWWFERSPRSVLFIAGGALVTVGALLWMRRRDYRATQAGYDPRAVDEQEARSRSSSPSDSSSSSGS